jgi:hypothetical protein
METLLCQDFQRPEALPGDRETGCPITDDFLARDILHDLLRPPCILPEFPLRAQIHETMGVAVAAQLMTRGLNSSNELREPFRGPPKDEEGCNDPGIRENVEEAIGVPLDTALKTPPRCW